MDFWRIYRIVNGRKYLILALTLITAAAILVGSAFYARRVEVTSEALLTPQDPPPTNNEGQPIASQTTAYDNSHRVSELVQMLRGNTTIYQDAANLLRLDEAARVREVRTILESNGFFAPVDANIENRLDQAVSAGDLPAADRPARLAKERDDARKQVVSSLARGRDNSGAFAVAGVNVPISDVVGTIRERMGFEPIQGLLATDNNPQFDNLIRIQGKFKREAEANLYVNMVCVAFVNWYATRSTSASTIRIEQLQRQRADAQKELGAARRALLLFRRGGRVEQMAGVNDVTPIQVQKYEDELNRAQQELDAATSASSSAAASLAATPKTLTTALPTEESPEVKRLRDQVNAAQIEYAALIGGNKGEDDWDVRSAKARLDTAKAALNSALAKPFTSSAANPLYIQFEQQARLAESNRVAAASRVSALKTQLSGLQQRMMALPAATANLSDLDRRVKIAETTLTKIEETLTREKLLAIQNGRGGSIVIASQAQPLPKKDAGASAGKLLAYGLVLSLLFGIVLVVALDSIDNTYKTKEDVEQLFGLPVAGEIPAQLPDPRRAPRIAFLDPLSPVSESYRLLRTDLLFSAMEHPFKSLVAITCKPGQGATTTISNLAITLAQSGKKVILVDADLRRPRLHEVFSAKNERGLTNLLNNQCAVEEALQTTEVDNLLLLPSGPLPLNPSELLGSQSMRNLHERLKHHSQADFVLFDSPSAIAFPDAAILASIIDSSLIVVRANGFPRSAERQVRELLERAKANILGMVINGVNPDLVDTVHYHNQYYSRGKNNRPDRLLAVGGTENTESASPIADTSEPPLGRLPATASPDTSTGASSVAPRESASVREQSPEPERSPFGVVADPFADDADEDDEDETPRRRGFFGRFRRSSRTASMSEPAEPAATGAISDDE